jgi:ATP-binding cassette subfamily F protein 3
MLVSHDRALLRETCDEFWLVAKGKVEPFDGDLDDYQKWLLDVSRAAARGQPLPDPPRAAGAPQPAAAPAPVAAAKPPPPSREERKNAKQARVKQSDATRPLRVELQTIDGRLARLAAEKAEVEALLARASTPADDYAELGRRLAHVAAETTMLEERWLVVQTELEALTTPS